MENRELSEDEIGKLLSGEREKGSGSYTIPGTNKTRRYDPNLRTVTNWFKLPHVLGTGKECEIPNHDEERQARNEPRLFFQMLEGKYKDKFICRWCFIESRDLDEH